MERLRALLADRDLFKGGTFLDFEPLPFLLDPAHYGRRGRKVRLIFHDVYGPISLTDGNDVYHLR